MGDRGHNRHGPKREGRLLCPFRGGAGSSSNTMWPGRGLLPYQAASSSIQPFGYNTHQPKTGGCAPFRGGSCDPISVSTDLQAIARHFGRLERMA